MSVQKARGIGHTKFRVIVLFPEYLKITIPEEWKISYLDDLLTQSISYGIILHDDNKEGIPVITSAALDKPDGIKNNLIYVSKHIEEKYKRTRLNSGEILISLVGYTGNIVVAPDWCKNYNVTRHIGVIKLKKEFNSNYFAYLLQSESYQKKINIMTIGSAQPVINLRELSKFILPIPSPIEQTNIALILSNVDSLIDQTQKIIDQTIILKKGLMQKLLTRGIGHTKFKKVKWYFGKEIEIPEEWNLIELRDIVTSYKNGIYKPDKFYGSGYPSIRMFNIVDGKIIKENAPFLQVDEQELDDYGLATGDIVINRVNSDYLVGKAGIVTDDLGLATFESKNIRVRIDTRKCIPNFVNMYFSTKDYFNQIRSFIKTAVGQVTINQEDLNHIMIKLPSLKEQQKIASILSNVDSKITDLQSKKFTLQKLKKGLMQKLLTGQIRVTV